MSNPINKISFQGFVPNQKPATKQIPHFTSSSNILSQPVKDQVSFSGAVLKVKTLQKIVKNIPGLEIVKASGNHPFHIVGAGLQRPIPFPAHSKDIATGTANQIAKQLGYDNVHKLLEVIK